MSENSNPKPRRGPRTPHEQLQARRSPSAGRLARALQALPERRFDYDGEALTFSATNGNVTAVLRLPLELPPSLSETLKIDPDPGAELSLESDRAEKLGWPLTDEEAWQLVVRLCRREYDSQRESSAAPDLPISAISRILHEEAIEKALGRKRVVFFGDRQPWAAFAKARGADVCIGTPRQATAIDFLLPYSGRTLVIDRTGTEEPPGADVLRAFGGSRLVYITREGDRTEEDPLARMLAAHWLCADPFELPHARHGEPCTYVAIWKRKPARPAEPKKHHRQVVAQATKVEREQRVGPETDDVLAQLWAECCRLRKTITRYARNGHYQPDAFGPGGPPTALSLAIAVECGEVAPDHQVLHDLKCHEQAAALVKSTALARRLASMFG